MIFPGSKQACRFNRLAITRKKRGALAHEELRHLAIDGAAPKINTQTRCGLGWHGVIDDLKSMHQQVTWREERTPLFLITQLNRIARKAGRLGSKTFNACDDSGNGGAEILCAPGKLISFASFFFVISLRSIIAYDVWKTRTNKKLTATRLPAGARAPCAPTK